MSGFEITCVNKNPNGMIVRIGGQGWSLSVNEAISKLISHQVRLNLLLDGQYVDIGVQGEGTNAFLTLEPAGKSLHEIKNLPGC